MKACFPTDILVSPLYPAESVENLGVWFDTDCSLSKHVESFCKSCFVQLRNSDMSDSTLPKMPLYLWSMLISSFLDNCNSPFRSFSKFNLHKLQWTQYSAAGIA